MNKRTRTMVGGGMLIAAFAVLTPMSAYANQASGRRCRLGSVRVYKTCRDHVSLRRRVCIADCFANPADGTSCFASCAVAARAEIGTCRDGYGTHRSICEDLAALPADTAACGDQLGACATEVGRQMSECRTDALRAASQVGTMSICAGDAADDLQSCDVEFADCVEAASE
jgi:hypothetical protein